MMNAKYMKFKSMMLKYQLYKNHQNAKIFFSPFYPLRFTASIANVGNADFLPFIPKSAWEWHACHQHYHSMEVS
jgi:hypothetical protein